MRLIITVKYLPGEEKLILASSASAAGGWGWVPEADSALVYQSNLPFLSHISHLTSHTSIPPIYIAHTPSIIASVFCEHVLEVSALLASGTSILSTTWSSSKAQCHEPPLPPPHLSS